MRYATVAGRSEFHMDPVKNSRFVATIDRVSSEEEALALVREVSETWADSRHHCWAYVLADGRHRSSDAGEPGGSAGRPILAQIEGHDLADVCVVVSRWFGGVKLGVGGLIRAYGGCAGKGLDRAEVVEVVPTVRLEVVHDYGDTSAVDAVLGQHGLEKTDATWTDAVRFAIDVPYDAVDEIRLALVDRTAGRAAISPPSG